MNREIVWTTKFKKDYKLAIKRHLDIDLLDDIIRALSRGEALPEKTKTMSCPGIGQDIGNVISSLIGYWSTALTMIFWC